MVLFIPYTRRVHCFRDLNYPANPYIYERVDGIVTNRHDVNCRKFVLLSEHNPRQKYIHETHQKYAVPTFHPRHYYRVFLAPTSIVQSAGTPQPLLCVGLFTTIKRDSRTKRQTRHGFPVGVCDSFECRISRRTV